MDFWGKTGCSGEDEEEKQQPPTADRLLSSLSSASYQHQHHSRHQPEQQQPIFSLPPYHHHHHHSSGGLLLDVHNEVGEPSTKYEEEGVVGRISMVEREHMFDKVVTPSDVGKLNRLVIPKQHAERFFPLDSSNNDKGLQLNFEDRNGKLWRFRYSYWNSSQSYVMTKGWSRFVKEKKLDAGDVVSFQRGVGSTAKDRLFIDWRRRINTSNPPHLSNLSFSFPNHNLFHPWNPLVLKSHPALPRREYSNLMLPPPNTSSGNVNNGGSRSVIYFRSGGSVIPQQHLQMIQRNGFGVGVEIDRPQPPQASQTPPLHGKGSGKRLRLFGVNMDCPLSEDEDDRDYDPPSSHGHSPPPPVMPPSSSSPSPQSTSIPYLQLSPYGEGNEYDQSTIIQSSSAHAFNIIAKSTASSMSLDLDI
ncbi:unnamed protein product [Lactuca virosa]|uniref:TF-B3 domain-containing protein n=1 Tax=Lactuca virosa TaxID=75947 RepID=A0AAU9MG49_9ASTR|nr:unnamed protein product [Lactuca virosa]